MGLDVELSSLDLRYESYRMKDKGSETRLLRSILDNGIRDPLEGVDVQGIRILLNGFKRYRCAQKLHINIVPYSSLGSDEAVGIIELIRISNAKSLSLLEQAKLISELKRVYKMEVRDIAQKLERSSAWVSMRIGIMSEMSDCVKNKIFEGKFPAYSYMYTLRQFMRMNNVKKDEIDKFVTAVAGKNLSIRDIEQVAYGYFKGPDEFREQIINGNITWVLERLREVPENSDSCNEYERGMLRDLEITQKYMQKVMRRSNDNRFRNSSFYGQANLLAGGILSKISIFTKVLKDFYDRTGQA